MKLRPDHFTADPSKPLGNDLKLYCSSTLPLEAVGSERVVQQWDVRQLLSESERSFSVWCGSTATKQRKNNEANFSELSKQMAANKSVESYYVQRLAIISTCNRSVCSALLCSPHPKALHQQLGPSPHTHIRGAEHKQIGTKWSFSFTQPPTTNSISNHSSAYEEDRGGWVNWVECGMAPSPSIWPY